MANAQQDMEIDLEILNKDKEDLPDTASLVDFPPLQSPIREKGNLNNPTNAQSKKGTSQTTSTKLEANLADDNTSPNSLNTIEARRIRINTLAEETSSIRISEEDASRRETPMRETSRNPDPRQDTTREGTERDPRNPRSTPHTLPQGNPYQRPAGTHSNFINSSSQRNAMALDKPIVLKRGLTRGHIHCYDLCIKVKTSQSEDEEFKILQQCLQKFFDIALQADPSSVIPPYF
jgi:hypothetical protein